MHKNLRLLLSGPGLIGKTHARILKANENCDLVAIVAPDHEENRATTSKLGAKFYPDLCTALDSERIDGVVLSSPNTVHFDQAMECVTRGIPALVEKPMTNCLEEAEQLVDAAKEKGVPLLVGHHRTYSALLDTALDFLRSEKFGHLVALQGTALFYKPDHYFEEGPWRALEGGGPLLINLIHEVGLMREFGGEIATVQAFAGYDVRQFEVEDTAAITLRFKNGALGTFVLSDAAASSKSWEMTSGENSAYAHFPQEACYHFAGTNGSLDFPSMRAKYYATPQDRSWWKPFEETTLAFEPHDPLVAQINHFLDVIRGTERPRVSADDGYRNMKVVDAIRRSICSGCAVDVLR